jgi:23S rRNA pseudouridine955/2504/2580 synthase
MSRVQQRHVTAEEAEMRLDRWFKQHFPGLGHGALEKLLRTGQVRVDGKRAKANLRLASGQVVRVPPLAETGAPGSGPKPERPVADTDARWLQDAVLYRDRDLLAIAKPAGLAVQGGTGTDRHLDAMLDALRFDAAERPRLVHRLDKDTSGVLLLARSAAAARWIGEAFRARDARKIYWAVVAGVPQPRQGKIDAPLAKLPGAAGERMAVDDAGKRAITLYSVVDRLGDKAAWVALMPLTGRTHQLRAHMALIGHPILGDGKYGAAASRPEIPGLARQLHLHARSIALIRPDGRSITVEAPLPKVLNGTWQAMGFPSRPAADPFPP